MVARICVRKCSDCVSVHACGRGESERHFICAGILVVRGSSGRNDFGSVFVKLSNRRGKIGVGRKRFRGHEIFNAETIKKEIGVYGNAVERLEKTKRRNRNRGGEKDQQRNRNRDDRTASCPDRRYDGKRENHKFCRSEHRRFIPL